MMTHRWVWSFPDSAHYVLSLCVCVCVSSTANHFSFCRLTLHFFVHVLWSFEIIFSTLYMTVIIIYNNATNERE